MDVYAPNKIYEKCCGGGYGGTLQTNESFLIPFSPFFEMKRGHESPVVPSKLPANTSEIKKSKITPCDVFLGGSCNPTTWRRDVAIPALKNQNISFFNPQVSTWFPELMELEFEAKRNANVLFFVIDNQTRAVAALIEVAYLVAKKRKIILVISGFKGPGQSVCNEPLSQMEYEDLTRSQLILTELVERHGIPVFNDIQTALKSTTKVIREDLHPRDLNLCEMERSGELQRSKFNVSICSNLRKTFDSLDSASKGEITLNQVRFGFRLLTGRELCKDDVKELLVKVKKLSEDIFILDNKKSDGNGFPPENYKLNFEEFSCMMSQLLFHHHYRESNSKCQLSKSPPILQTISSALDKLIGIVPDLSSQETISTNENDSNEFYDIYLGGSSSLNDDWRNEIAIPLLKNEGLHSFNPEAEEKMKLFSNRRKGIEKSNVLLFYLTDSTRSVESMTMAAYYFGLGTEVVICIKYLKDECLIEGEKLSPLAIKDYNRGRSYLSDTATREGVPVFDNIQDAIKCAIEKAKNLKQNFNFTSLETPFNSTKNV